MSGIAGIVRFDGAPIEPGTVEKMTAAMASRGPDGIRHWHRDPAALGQCMLCTTPESLNERQPLTNEDEGIVLVLDGRVDNREELKRELEARGAVLRDDSDAELVLRAFEAWREECPDRIIGEFVFLVWDAKERLLFGARDAAGTRHFHYHAGGGWFAFASEIRGLLALGRIEPRLNESRLLDYLVEDFDRDDEVGTFYQGINRLPAGHAMLATERGLRTWRYWDPANLSESHFGSLDDCAEGLLDQLRIAVKCRLRSNGPVGAMLSGGLDSSSIVGLIRKEFRADLRQPLKTFSLIREDRENCHDWRNIRLMLEDGWVEPTIITSAVAGEVCRSHVDAIPQLDEPFALSNGFIDSLVYRAAASSGCRVVMDGMAGDLLFHSFDRSLSFRAGMFAHVPAVLAAARRHREEKWLLRLVKRAVEEAAPWPVRDWYRKVRARHAMPAGDIRLLHRETATRFLAAKCLERERQGFYARPENEQDAHARNYTRGLLSFAHEVNGQIALSLGVEPRSPYSDRRIIEFGIRLPMRAKLFAHWYKHLLRRSMRGVLPEEVIWRRDLGNHPGGKFHEGFISELRRCAPEVWNRGRVEGTLARWIDAVRLEKAWGKYERSADLSTGLNLMVLAVLSRWLVARFPGPVRED